MSVTIMLGGEARDMDRTLTCGMHLAKRLGSPLRGLCALPDPAASIIYITGAEAVMVGASALSSLSQAQDKMAKDIEAHFHRRTNSQGWLQAHFVKEVGSVSAHTAMAGLLADAFVMPRSAARAVHPLNPGFAHALMEARLPLILAPDQDSASDTCLIAWDGSPLAARTVKLHMPLIETYKTAILAHHPGKIRHQWAHVCQSTKTWLVDLLHDKRLNVIEEELTGSVADGLLSAASTHNAAMIIMGAYGHNRLGELIFGGTTRKLLHSPEAPALALCH